MNVDDEDMDFTNAIEPLSAAMRRLSMVSNRHNPTFAVTSSPGIKGRKESLKLSMTSKQKRSLMK